MPLTSAFGFVCSSFSSPHTSSYPRVLKALRHFGLLDLDRAGQAQLCRQLCSGSVSVQRSCGKQRTRLCQSGPHVACSSAYLFTGVWGIVCRYATLCLRSHGRPHSRLQCDFIQKKKLDTLRAPGRVGNLPTRTTDRPSTPAPQLQVINPEGRCAF